MRLLLAVLMSMAMASGASAQAANTPTLDILATAADPGCVTVANADPRLSPPDLGLGVLACAKVGNMASATDLYLLMRLRASFDTRRVADVTAHRADTELSMQVGERMSSEDKAQLESGIGQYRSPGSARHKAFCTAIAAAVPDHDPAWMIQHGMGTIADPASGGLVAGFDAMAAWGEIVTAFKCE